MKKTYGLSLVLTLVVMVSAFQVIYAKHQNRQAFIELQKLKQQQDQMETEWGQLQRPQYHLVILLLLEDLQGCFVQVYKIIHVSLPVQ